MLLLDGEKDEKLIARKACIERMKPIINGNVRTTISARDSSLFFSGCFQFYDNCKTA